MAPLLRRLEADEVTFRSPQSRRPSADSLASRGDKAARREGRETKGERQQAPDPEQRSGGVDMPTVKKSVEVDVPVRVAYDQWTQFEEFPRFMDSVEEVQQLDDKRLHWRARVGGRVEEWDAEIAEQVPDKIIVWRSTSGARNDGIVRFVPLGASKTKVELEMHWDPKDVTERIGDALGADDARIQGDLGRFKKFIEERRTPTGAWRGQIHGGRVEGVEEDQEAGTGSRS